MYKSIAGLVLLSLSTLLYGQDIYLEPPDPQAGYININELTGGYGLGSTDVPYSKYFYGFTTIHGYEFNIEPHNLKSGLSIGAGAGMQFYDEGAMFPLFADARFTIIRNKISPFIFVNGGLLISPDDIRDQSMLTINGGLGTRIRLIEKLNLSTGAGLFVQFHNDDMRDAFINVRVGVTFKPGRRETSSRILAIKRD